MNSATICHELPGCNGLFIDAFRGKYLKKTRENETSFILTHYHGDHYGSLPRDGKYQGPALIHCTPVTGSLLKEVHQVPAKFIVEHRCGETWLFRPRESPTKPIQVTFYDANHCPGAVIIVVKLSDETVHLHTGDMRYHEKMKSYPLLKEAADARAIDLVLLDTTYGNPKHDFLPQETAIDLIASQVEELLGTERSETSSTLVLLSCYSIGKEKVLWEASSRSGQLVYVNERKMRMLECIRGHGEVSSHVVERCTQDTDLSDIHVIPMGLAGEMWPFFQPNYWACADYTKDLSRSYDKVVAFMPTGWADATNWNKKNAVSKQHCKGIDVEIRLISYSEHSAFSELKTFVDFLRPRKVIPTVFKDEKDSQRIEARFKIDLGRAKQHFINTMVVSPASSKETATPTAAVSLTDRNVTVTDNKEDSRKRKSIESASSDLTSLVVMGFDLERSEQALRASSGDLDGAIEALLKPTGSTPSASSIKQVSSASKPQTSPRKSSRSITDFFAVKKKKG